MAKVERGVTPKAAKRDWLTEADVYKAEGNVSALRLLYTDAVAAKADASTVAIIKDYGSTLAQNSAGLSSGAAGAN